MPVLTFYEHQFRPYTGLPPLSPAALAAFDRLNAAAGSAIVTAERSGLRAGGQVGVVRVGALQVEILPWLAAADPPTEPLFALLSLAFDLPLRFHQQAGLRSGTGSWVELLARMFAVSLLREVQAGLPRGYQSDSQILPVLRGRWDVPRQLARTGGLRGDFTVRLDQWTAGLPLNHLFRFVIERLSEQPFSRSTRALLADLRERFAGVALLPEFPPTQAARLRLNRLNERFAQPLALARLFLAGQPLRLRAGSLPVSAFTFSMAALFERALSGLFAADSRRILPPALRDSRVIRQGEGLRLHLARAGNNPLHPLRPDLLLRMPDQPAPWLVIDAKYKPLPADPADLYQMLAYMGRLRCPTGLLLYPQTGAPVRRALKIEAAPVTVWLATVNLVDPAGLAQELAAILQGCFAND